MIKYKKGYRFQTVADYVVKIDIFPKADIETHFLNLSKKGWLKIGHGYAWNGASGTITIQTDSIIRGSLIHDALYQLIRMELLNNDFREAADIELKKACLEDGMFSWRAWYVYRAVRWFGASAASPENKKEIFEAP